MAKSVGKKPFRVGLGIFAVGVVFVLVVILILVEPVNNDPDDSGSPGAASLQTKITSQSQVLKVEKRQNNKRIGRSEAGVVVSEAIDYQCPACARYHQEIIKNFYSQLKSGQGLENFALEIRHYPLEGHENARFAHQAAEAALGQNRFWEMHDYLFKNQAAWANLAKDQVEDYFLTAANELGLDLEEFAATYSSSETLAAIQADQDYMDSLGQIIGTPTLAINGEIVPPNQLPVTWPAFLKTLSSD